MFRLASFLLHGCWHHWEVIKVYEVHWSNDFGDSRVYDCYALQCKHCGTIRTKHAR